MPSARSGKDLVVWLCSKSRYDDEAPMNVFRQNTPTNLAGSRHKLRVTRQNRVGLPTGHWIRISYGFDVNLLTWHVEWLRWQYLIGLFCADWISIGGLAISYWLLLTMRTPAELTELEHTSAIIIWEEVPVSLEQNRFDHLTERRKALRVRYVYSIIFLVTNLSAWFVRDYAQRMLPELHYLKSCGHGGRDCFHTQGVLRVSLGCFIFFFLMFLTTCKTRKLYNGCNAWHSGWWGSKLFLLLVSMMISLICPSDYIHFYGEIARVGAGIFLVLQLISVIQFIRWWNKYWMPDEQKKQSCSLGLFMSTLFYIASLCGIVVMYSSYAMKFSCALNIFFIIWTAVLLVVMMSVSLHSKVNKGLLSSGIMASYIVFLCWSAVRSEPANEECNPQRHDNANGDWTTILGFLIAICAIVMATFSTGIDSQSFQFRQSEVQHEDDIPYKYGFFHLIFSLGAMYFAMLFISWNLNNSAKKWSIDVGWASTWVKIVNEWFAASIYLWTLFSPVLRQSKVMDHEEPAVQDIDSSDVLQVL